MILDATRHCFYMIGEDLEGTSGLEIVKKYDTFNTEIEKILYMGELLTDLENQDSKKFEKRKEYVTSVLSR